MIHTDFLFMCAEVGKSEMIFYQKNPLLVRYFFEAKTGDGRVFSE